MTRSVARRTTIALLFLLSVVAIFQQAAAARPAPRVKLVVGLYPDVPRLEQFKTAIADAWAEVQPSVSLEFLPKRAWDGGYSQDPPSRVDVYVFDAMFLEYFRSRRWLEPLAAREVEGLADFVPYAVEGVKVGDLYYGIPQLGCANLLFYEKTDAELARAETLGAVNAALGQCTYTGRVPPGGRGLMINMAGNVNSAAFYLDSAHSATEQYPLPLPWTRRQINPDAVVNLRKMLAMASWENGAVFTAGPYERSAWWSGGAGRAVVGYSESMSAMSEATRQSLAFKPMPLSDRPDARPLFYADVIGVHPATHQRRTRDLAVQLANVMAAPATMIASIGPDASNPFPQYLLSTRPSIYEALGKAFPIYDDLYAMVTRSRPQMFKLDDRARAWLRAMGPTLREDALRDYPCGCDFFARKPIADSAAAAAICPKTCADHGGWAGEWTNDPPDAPGRSVCTCRACPTLGADRSHGRR